MVFYDSGIGGLPYLEWVRRRLSGESFIYIADDINFPFGEKPTEVVRGLVVDTIGRIMDLFKPKLIVIACNTASVTTLSTLRSMFPVPFVGVVPAIKPAASNSVYRRIGLLATSRTVADVYTENLIETFASGCTVMRQAGGHLVEFIELEYQHSTLDERRRLVTPVAESFIEGGVDSVVLGCTHFLFLKEELADALGPEIRIIDSVEGVGRQTLRLLSDRSTHEHHGFAEVHRLYHTGPIRGEENILAAFASKFELEYAGILPKTAEPVHQRGRNVCR